MVAIGVDKRGFQLRLENEIKSLNTPELTSGVPVCKIAKHYNVHMYIVR